MKKFGVPPKTNSKTIAFNFLNKNISIRVGQLAIDAFNLFTFSCNFYPEGLFALDFGIMGYGFTFTVIQIYN
jgi:hypothetical protein